MQIATVASRELAPRHRDVFTPCRDLHASFALPSEPPCMRQPKFSPLLEFPELHTFQTLG